MSARAIVVAAAASMLAVVLLALYVGDQAGRLDPAAPAGDAAPAATAPSPATGAPFVPWGTTEDGDPVRWDPCTPIPWVLDTTNAPPDARETVSLAMARISAASGLEFEYRGATTELPSRDRSLVTTDGGAWAPVLITWVPGDSTDLPLGDAERGVSVPVAVRDGGPRVFVTGQVVLNSDKRLLTGFEDRHASWGAVVLHELAHLVGLDHVDDPSQLMHPTPGFGPVELGAGDLAGLAAVGAGGGCVEVPDPQELEVTFAQ